MAALRGKENGRTGGERDDAVLALVVGEELLALRVGGHGLRGDDEGKRESESELHGGGFCV